MRRWVWLSLLIPLMAACGFTVKDKGSDINVSGVRLIYTDWVSPTDGNWEKDSLECDYQAREAVPSLIRMPGRRQLLAERCLMERGYTRR
jgi:hypothetical protein